MVHGLLLFLQVHILPLGAYGVFIASLIEEVIAPIPSAVVMLGSGFLFVKGVWSLQIVIDTIRFVALPAALGVTIGSLFVYSIARFVGVELLIRFGTIFGVTKESVHKAETYFKDHNKDEVAVFIARVIPVVPAVVIALGAGLIRMPLGRYIGISFVGTLIRAFILGIIGWQTGEVYATYADIIGRWENYILGLLLGSVICVLVYAFFKNKYRTIE